MKKLKLAKRVICGLCDLVAAAAIFVLGCIVGSNQVMKVIEKK